MVWGSSLSMVCSCCLVVSSDLLGCSSRGLHWVPPAATCYNIKSVSNEDLTKFSEKFIVAGYAVSFFIWQRLIRGADGEQPKGKVA